jgi:uncharacterized protein (DUF4415 family)
VIARAAAAPISRACARRRNAPFAARPPDLADLPRDFFAEASIAHPKRKQPISLRVDEDVLAWFKAQGPRYQSRMKAVLRAYMAGS